MDKETFEDVKEGCGESAILIWYDGEDELWGMVWSNLITRAGWNNTRRLEEELRGNGG